MIKMSDQIKKKFEKSGTKHRRKGFPDNIQGKIKPAVRHFVRRSGLTHIRRILKNILSVK